MLPLATDVHTSDSLDLNFLMGDDEHFSAALTRPLSPVSGFHSTRSLLALFRHRMVH